MHISWTFLLHGIDLVYPLFPGTKGLIREGKTFRDSFIKITFKSEEKISYIIKKNEIMLKGIIIDCVSLLYEDSISLNYYLLHLKAFIIKSKINTLLTVPIQRY